MSFRPTRKNLAESQSRIRDFWLWWNEAGPRFDVALAEGSDPHEMGRLVDEIDLSVNAINPGLEWEFSSGTVAKHVLCVTAAGNSLLRSTAERWRRAAPPTTSIWEFRSARSRDLFVLGHALSIDDFDIAVAATRFGVTIDEDRQVVDLVVSHPLFAELSVTQQDQVMSRLLGSLLGEDLVERWVGTVEVAITDPPDTIPAEELHDVVLQLRDRNAEPTYAVLQGTDSLGQRILVVTRRPLKPAEYPLFDLHGAIDHPYTNQTLEGLPGPSAVDQIQQFEKDLVEFVEDRAILAAVVSMHGSRTFHLYCDSASDTSDSVDRWLKSFPNVRATWTMDHSWEATEEF
jgi:Family of unknown function (DUF695)